MRGLIIEFECLSLMSWFDVSLMCDSFCTAFQAPVENFWVTAWAGLTIKKTTRIPPKSGHQKTLDLSRDLNFRFPNAKDYFIDLFCFCLSQSISYIKCTVRGYKFNHWAIISTTAVAAEAETLLYLPQQWLNLYQRTVFLVLMLNFFLAFRINPTSLYPHRLLLLYWKHGEIYGPFLE